jgi:hypothetical protein
MPCYKPLKAWKARRANPSGKRGITFNKSEGFSDQPVELPCGQCIGCRLEKSRQWAMRCMNEAQLHEDNCFLTLTYDDKHLPPNANLHLPHFQKFLKRLRKSLHPQKIRFFHCGEYGQNDPQNPKHNEQYGISELGRPHYHALIFGWIPDDLELIRDKDGIRLYMSHYLEKLWPYGYNTVGSVTFDSAAYVARYCVKKINGDNKSDHYRRTNPQTGETIEINSEYTTMSRRPGIGTGWYEKYKSDVFPKDYTVINGKRVKPPKFYDSILEKEDLELYNNIKAARVRNAKRNKEENTPERLAQKEQVKNAQNSMLIRPLDT